MEQCAELRTKAEQDAEFFCSAGLATSIVLEMMEQERGAISHCALAALRRTKAAAEGSEEYARACEDLAFYARRYAEMSLAKEIVEKGL